MVNHGFMATDITTIWARVEAHAGECFHQKRGDDFRYEVHGGCVIPDRTNRFLPRCEFEKALQQVPLDGPGEIRHLQGPSYIYAVLMDRRIRGDDW